MKCNTLKDTKRLAREFASSLHGRQRAVVLFEAPMGAGKTTFIREAVRCLGVRVGATSPTFSIINKYSENTGTVTPQSGHVYHIDLYRVESADELFNTDFYEIISGDNIVFIEWAEKFDIKYPDGAIIIKIKVGEDDSRVFDITG